MAGSFGLGTSRQIADRLRGARNRLAGGVASALRDAERDCNCQATAHPEIMRERAYLEEALAVLLRQPPEALTREELAHRQEAERAGLRGSRSHGELW